MSSNFTLTGEQFPPLPENHPVKVVMNPNNDRTSYAQIGILQILQSDMNNLSKAIELAKEKARMNGADIIVLLNSDSSTEIGSTGDIIYSSEEISYIFEIGRINSSPSSGVKSD